MKMTELQKHRQMNREALISLIIYLLFFLWWYFTGYGLSELLPDIFVMGFPLWFFLSCIIGWILMSIAVFTLVKTVFRDFELTIDDSFNDKEGQ